MFIKITISLLIVIHLISYVLCENLSKNSLKFKIIHPKIVGGIEATMGEFKGQVALHDWRNHHRCGGTLITPNHILTAAQCLYDGIAMTKPEEIRIMGDDLSINEISPDPLKRQIRYVSHIFVHPNFNMNNFENDIAIVRVIPNFNITNTFQTVSRSVSTPLVNSLCSVAGWGLLEYNTTLSSDKLLKVHINIMNTNNCNVSHTGDIRPGMLCAGVSTGGKDACVGDSGGGLICSERVSGIVSTGRGCGLAAYPGVYTDVSSFNNWINQVLTFNGSNSEIAVPTPPSVCTEDCNNDGKALKVSFLFNINFVLFYLIFIIIPYCFN